jgi:hypothetical protein
MRLCGYGVSLTGGICSLWSHIPARLAAGFAEVHEKKLFEQVRQLFFMHFCGEGGTKVVI